MLLGTTHRSSVPNFSLVPISSGSNPKLTVLQINGKGVDFSNNSPVGYSLEPE